MTLSMGDDDEEITLLFSAMSADGNGGERTNLIDNLPADATAVEDYDGE